MFVCSTHAIKPILKQNMDYDAGTKEKARDKIISKSYSGIEYFNVKWLTSVKQHFKIEKYVHLLLAAFNG